MAKRTMRDGTIVHTREGEPKPYTPTFAVKPGTDLLELLHPERAVERLEAEAALLRAVADAARGILRWHDEEYGWGDGIPKFWDDMDNLRAALTALDAYVSQPSGASQSRDDEKETAI